LSKRLGRIAALLRKDARALLRHKMLLVLSGFSLAMMAGAFWLTPNRLDERILVGVVAAAEDPLLATLKRTANGALTLRHFADEEALKAALDGGTEGLLGGLLVPRHLRRDLGAGRPVELVVLVPPELSPAGRRTLQTLVRETALALAGQSLPVGTPELHEMVVGEDKMGHRTAPRTQVAGLLVVMVLLMELLVLALLVADEIRFGTAAALLATPLSAAELIGAKALFGVAGALLQLGLFSAAIGGLPGDPLALIAVFVLGALMITGMGLLLGATGRDLQGMTGWLIVAIVPLMLPVITTAVPALDAPFVHALPTWPMIGALTAVTVEGAGLAAVFGELAGLAAWAACLLVAGTWVLRRRVARA
jgi:ABC-2 type transport system permease protein